MTPDVQEAIYRLKVEGQQQIAQLKGEIEKTIVVEEKFGNVTRMTEQSLQNRIARLDPAIKVQEQYRKELEYNKRLTEAGVGTEAQRNAHLALATQRYSEHLAVLGKVSAANDNVTSSLKPARFELINLSRQIQDVGVSLAGGQSPFQVLIQQGTQIADIMAASNASVGSFFRTSIAWAGRFVTSAAGVAAGLAGIGAAALYMGSSFESAQRDIDKALSGIGAASGLSRGSVNKIAEGASSPFGLSVSEARAAATAFVATGKLYGDNVRQATQITKQFALAMGIDAAEAAKQLAKGLQDPVSAALEWNKTLGFLDSKTLDYIQSLASMGRRQDAIGALINAAVPSIGRAAEQTGYWARAWDFVANKASNAADAIGKATARGVERVTGLRGGGFTDEERATNLRDQIATRERGAFGQGLDVRAISQMKRELAEVEERIRNVAKNAEAVRFGQATLEAREFSRSINEGTAQIERLQAGIASIEKAQAMRQRRDGGVDPAMEQAVQLARVQLATALELEQTEMRKAQVLSQNVIKYQETSVAIANQRALLDAQLVAAQAITGQQQIEAQHRLTIVQLQQQGLSLSDATKIADQQRAIAVAQVNAEADRTLKSLQEQGQLLSGDISEAERGRIRAAQEYNRLLEQGVDAQKAGAVAAQMQANARAEADAREEAQQTARVAQEGAAAARSARERARANAQAAEAAEAESQAMRDLITNSLPLMYSYSNFGIPSAYGDKYVQGKNAFNNYTTQFNPAGYQSTIMTDALDPRLRSLPAKVRAALTGEQEKPIDPIDRAVQEQLDWAKSVKDAMDKSVEALKQNTEAVNDNTQALTDVLSPLYSSDPRMTHLGFRAFAGGGIMTSRGPLPIRSYAGGGVAYSPQVSVFGEGSTPEAYVPVPTGRIPVEMRGANNNRPITINNNFYAPATREMAAEFKRTAFQNAQQLRKVAS